jgi:hypothetical protein
LRPLQLFPALHKLNVDCARLMTLYAGGVSRDPGELRELRSVKVGAATVVGNRATVLVSGPRGLREAPLERTACGWRISRLIVALRRPRAPISG